MRTRNSTAQVDVERFIHYQTPESKLATCICTRCLTIFAVPDENELAAAQAAHDCGDAILSRYNGNGRYRTSA